MIIIVIYMLLLLLLVLVINLKIKNKTNILLHYQLCFNINYNLYVALRLIIYTIIFFNFNVTHIIVLEIQWMSNLMKLEFVALDIF